MCRRLPPAIHHIVLILECSGCCYLEQLAVLPILSCPPQLQCWEPLHRSGTAKAKCSSALQGSGLIREEAGTLGSSVCPGNTPCVVACRGKSVIHWKGVNSKTVIQNSAFNLFWSTYAWTVCLFQTQALCSCTAHAVWGNSRSRIAVSPSNSYFYLTSICVSWKDKCTNKDVATVARLVPF